MAVGNSGVDSQSHELYMRVRAARRQSRELAARHREARRHTAELLELIYASFDREGELRMAWRAHLSAALLRYPASARPLTPLASVPVIEQAKGIIMARCGWPEDQAADALRRASQEENIMVQNLAAKIVASTYH